MEDLGIYPTGILEHHTIGTFKYIVSIGTKFKTSAARTECLGATQNLYQNSHWWPAYQSDRS